MYVCTVRIVLGADFKNNQTTKKLNNFILTNRKVETKLYLFPIGSNKILLLFSCVIVFKIRSLHNTAMLIMMLFRFTQKSQMRTKRYNVYFTVQFKLYCTILYCTVQSCLGSNCHVGCRPGCTICTVLYSLNYTELYYTVLYDPVKVHSNMSEVDQAVQCVLFCTV